MTAITTPDVALRKVVALRRRCACGDKLLPGEIDRGVCDPCAGVPSEVEPVSHSALGWACIVLAVAVLLVVLP